MKWPWEDKLEQLPENVIDLDAYREQRRADGTFPYTDDLVYWERQRAAKKLRQYGVDTGGPGRSA